MPTFTRSMTLAGLPSQAGRQEPSVLRLRRKPHRLIAAFLRRYRRDCRGHVSIIFGLALLPILTAVGAAIDYSRATSARTSMQVAVDATALMLSKEAPNLTQEQLVEKSNDYFTALFKNSEVSNASIKPTLSTPQEGSFKLSVTGTGTVETKFIRVVGSQQIDISTNTEVRWGIKKLELALALDNTGSMSSSNKIKELKAAAHSLLTTLQQAAKEPDDVKVAIIPFDTKVRISTNYKSETWFDWSLFEWTGIDCNGSAKGSGCSGKNPKDYWDGCVEDRTQPYDVKDDEPNGGNSATLYPPVNCNGSLAEAMPLSTDWAALNSKIDTMQPNGYTNVTIGLVWAWHALTGNQPLNEGKPASPDTDKVIIVLTDGDNTRNRWTTSQSSIDARTAAVCSNIKQQNIRIYAVRVIDGNATLLKNCATNPTMYYDVQQADDLSSVFTSIAQNLANLRISQ